MTNEELRKSLLADPQNGYQTLTEEQRKEMNEYCADYIEFLSTC